MFALSSSILLSVSDPVVEMSAKRLSEFNTKCSGGTGCVSLHSCRPLRCDHEKFSKSNTRFFQTFIKTAKNKQLFLEKTLYISFLK